MNALANSKNKLPNLKNDGRMHVHLSGNHFQQNKVIIPNNNNVIKYLLRSSVRSNSFNQRY